MAINGTNIIFYDQNIQIDLINYIENNGTNLIIYVGSLNCNIKHYVGNNCKNNGTNLIIYYTFCIVDYYYLYVLYAAVNGTDVKVNIETNYLFCIT